MGYSSKTVLIGELYDGWSACRWGLNLKEYFQLKKKKKSSLQLSSFQQCSYHVTVQRKAISVSHNSPYATRLYSHACGCTCGCLIKLKHIVCQCKLEKRTTTTACLLTAFFCCFGCHPPPHGKRKMG